MLSIQFDHVAPRIITIIIIIIIIIMIIIMITVRSLNEEFTRLAETRLA